ncbi:hypothetical protein [Peribacillus frigoritolerans]|uniref:hypothetical protein n=1 Tax=Peribacillus frigoritolerans TaxID=450367 RepID=UPI0007BECA3E|nr:hypothetical protein [Peribacillus frigoritolerans]
MDENQALKKNRRGTEYIEANGGITAKRCSGCGQMMELEHFANLKAGLGGTRSKCRPCLVEYGKKYNKKRPHNFVREMDDLDNDDKVYRYQIDEVHSIDELKHILDDVGWKLTLEDFFLLLIRQRK